VGVHSGPIIVSVVRRRCPKPVAWLSLRTTLGTKIHSWEWLKRRLHLYSGHPGPINTSVASHRCRGDT
jgi:hypothetical protein